MYYQEYVSPIGKMYMTSDGEYLTGLFFDDSRDNFKKALDERKELSIFLETKRWLDIYFKGENPNFTPSYRIENLTPFRKEVLDQIKKIPYGKVITYGDIAKEIARKDTLVRVKKLEDEKRNGYIAISTLTVGGFIAISTIIFLIVGTIVRG